MWEQIFVSTQQEMLVQPPPGLGVLDPPGTVCHYVLHLHHIFPQQKLSRVILFLSL